MTNTTKTYNQELSITIVVVRDVKQEDVCQETADFIEKHREAFKNLAKE